MLEIKDKLYCRFYFFPCRSRKRTMHLKRTFLCRNLEFKSIGWKNCSVFVVVSVSFISIMSTGKEQAIVVNVYSFIFSCFEYL